MTKEQRNNLELVKSGFANGISMQLATKQAIEGPDAELTREEKQAIIDVAATHYGHFLSALGVDWENDPNSSDTPRRVAKAYVNDLWAGRYNPMSGITAFPSDGYDGIVQESNIPVTSMCSHHHETIMGNVSIAYIPAKDGKVVGLSKLNRIVEHFGRRGSIQEQLTVAIHNAVDQICEGNLGVAVMINATHNCVQCRGVKHRGASMQTAKLSGAFLDDAAARAEFYKNMEFATSCKHNH
jgi:GTP cyclohydrolase IA